MKAALTVGSYQSRSVIASAQRCVNLYLEANPQGSVFPFTHYPTPGLTALITSLNNAPVRAFLAATKAESAVNEIIMAEAGASTFFSLVILGGVKRPKKKRSATSDKPMPANMNWGFFTIKIFPAKLPD